MQILIKNDGDQFVHLVISQLYIYYIYPKFDCLNYG